MNTRKDPTNTHKPKGSGYAGHMPGEDEEDPDDTEPTPPGEHKREPIKDPDPADTKLHVQA